jgi:chromate transporter
MIPSLHAATRVWARIGLLSFGGPAGQIALMHRELVDERRWIGERDFVHALNFCMLLPGPEAQQLATYVGWRMHGVPGGLVAGTLFILPGFLAIMALSLLYALAADLTIVEGLLFGLRAAVIALVAQALVRMGKRLVGNATLLALAVAAFAAIFVFAIPFPLVIALAALTGFLASRAGSTAFAGAGHGSEDGPEAAIALPPPDVAGARRAGLIAFLLWGLLAAIAALALGGIWRDLAGFFSQMAVVTFGGAYAVLAWVAQAAVERFGWLDPREMLDGLGLAETTPGPLILVLQFVGFLAAFRDPGSLPPVLAGLLGGTLTVLVTFLPCFAWIFLGAPVAERLRESKALKAALTAVTAAVVGVVANLALWFALQSLFGAHRPSGIPGTRFDVPVLASADWAGIALAAAALVAAFRFHAGLVPLLAGGALAGLLLRFSGLA